MEKGLSTIDLWKILSKDDYSRSCFIGVFPRDRLPMINFYPCAFIINTESSDLPGQHWLGFYYDNEKCCTFFDSFGNSPQKFGLTKFLKKTSLALEFNKHRLQGELSFTCGHFCIFFILLKSRNFSLQEIVDFFDKKNFCLNDFKVGFLI